MDLDYNAARNLDFDSTSNASSATNGTTDENTQVFGPTTRRKWTEWVAKPKSTAHPTPLTSSVDEESENVS